MPHHARASLRLPPLSRLRLGNGLQVVLASRPRLPLVVARLELWVGSSADTPGREGLADFTAQLLRRGTRRRDAEGIDSAIERVGGSLGIDVDQDSTALVVSVPAEHLEVALQVLAELAAEAAFPLAEVGLARRRTLASLANEIDDPSTVADLAVSRELWGAHPYGHSVSGRPRSVKGFARSVARHHFKRWFHPHQAHLFIVGAFDEGKARRAAEWAFDRWTGGTTEALVLPPLKAPAGRRVILVDKPDATQTQLRLAGPGLARRDERYLAASVAASILGGGFTSRLMEELRVKRGLTYGVSSRFYAYRFAGELAVSTFTANEKVGRCLSETLRVCRQLAERGATAEEVRRTATYLSGLYPLQLETNEQIARLLGDLVLHDLPEEHVTHFADRVHGVSRSEVQAIARDFFPHEAYVLLAVGPARELRPQLAAFGPISVVPLSGVL